MHQCNILENGSFAVYVAAPNDPAREIDARDNWWGVTDSISIEALVRHQRDVVNYPFVRYVPFALEAFEYEDTVFTNVDDQTDAAVPREFKLLQNYPNPFNLATRIEFCLQRSGFVGIDIINIRGQRIRTLVSELMPAGQQAITWDGTDSFGGEVASGVYFCRLVVGDFTDTKKMLLLK